MKIAVTCENNEVFQHFGHTPEFAVFETMPGKIISEYRLATGENGHGALATLLASEKVDLLICGGIGGGAQAALKAAGIRAELDDRNETLKYRIREAQLDKIPYMLVVGEKEQNDGTVAVRAPKEEDGGVMKVEDFMSKALMEIATKKR